MAKKGYTRTLDEIEHYGATHGTDEDRHRLLNRIIAEVERHGGGRILRPDGGLYYRVRSPAPLTRGKRAPTAPRPRPAVSPHNPIAAATAGMIRREEVQRDVDSAAREGYEAGISRVYDEVYRILMAYPHAISSDMGMHILGAIRQLADVAQHRRLGGK